MHVTPVLALASALASAALPASPRAPPPAAPCTTLAAQYRGFDRGTKFRSECRDCKETSSGVWVAAAGSPAAAAAAALLLALLRHVLGHRAALTVWPAHAARGPRTYGAAPAAALPCPGPAPAAPGYGADRTAALQPFYCTNKFLVAIILYDNISCFHITLKLLHKKKFSFLFPDRNSTLDRPELLPLGLYTNNNNSDKISSCPFGLPRVRECSVRKGNDMQMIRSAQDVANVINKFSLQRRKLIELTSGETDDNDFNIETAACNWALRNKPTIESWITQNPYKLYTFMCIEDPLKEQYEVTLIAARREMNRILPFTVQPYHISTHCNDHFYMLHNFTSFMNLLNDPLSMGAIVWSSSEAIPKIVQKANENQIPVVLVGAVSSQTRIGSTTLAISGRLEDHAQFYHDFLKNCEWARLAILSDGSEFGKAFKNALVKDSGLIYTERILTLETVSSILSSLKNEDAHIFIVNTDTLMAQHILLSAIALDMTPDANFAWIVRDWNPDPNFTNNGEWSVMKHFTLSTSWRGEDGRTGGAAGGGNARLRAELQRHWDDVTLPTLAGPLADAALMLGQRTLRDLCDADLDRSRRAEYYTNFSRIYDTLNVTGVTEELRSHNGVVKPSVVYLEQWEGHRRVVLASWRAHRSPFQEHGLSICGRPRAADRSPCLLAAGGSDFVQRCYDPPFYALLFVLILLPGIFFLVQRIRLKRLEERDHKLVANLLGNKHSMPVVNKVFLHKQKVIGKGNFGRVYLATLKQSPHTTVSVAAKELWNDGDKKEYLHEARILKSLNHKNIVKFVGICVANGSVVILMEYASYGDLLQYLQARRHLAESGRGEYDDTESTHVSAEALTRLASEAAAALDYLAQLGLVHRDVRAANCLIDNNRTLKLADFGMARKLGDDQKEYTTIRAALFPVVWMAPESLNHGTFSTASDVWGLGLLLLQLSTLGRRPYGDWPPHIVMEFVRLGGHPPLPSDISPETRSLVLACWRRAAAERPSAAAVLRFLRREPRALRAALQPPPAPRLADAPAQPRDFLAHIVTYRLHHR